MKNDIYANQDGKSTVYGNDPPPRRAAFLDHLEKRYRLSCSSFPKLTVAREKMKKKLKKSAWNQIDIKPRLLRSKVTLPSSNDIVSPRQWRCTTSSPTGVIATLSTTLTLVRSVPPPPRASRSF